MAVPINLMLNSTLALDLNPRPASIVLVSGPDDALRRALSRVLAYEGFAVVPVPDLLRALMYLNREIEAEHYDAVPDVVITDVPSGADHDEALALARSVARRVPVVLVTDAGDANALADSPCGSIIEMVEKPVTASKLTAAVLRAKIRRRRQ